MDAMDQIIAPSAPVVTEGSRVSVFSRLTPKASFAAVVGEQSSMGLVFFPLEDKKARSVTIPIELAKEAAKAYSSTIVGYFLGSRIPFPVVQRTVQSAWAKYGCNDVMMNNNGFFFIKFNDEGGSQRAVEEGMLMVRNVPLFVSPWDPSKGLFRPSHDSCPLWVKLHNVPLVLFNKEGISRIASALGVPKRMDACTASMCDKKWGRPGFAKVLIDVWATGELKKELEVVIPHLQGNGCDTIKIEVEYIWEPNQCSHCCVFGHKRSACAKAVRSSVAAKKPIIVDEDGFTKVERKQWRRKDSSSSSLASGTTPSGHDKEASASGTKGMDDTLLENEVLEENMELPTTQAELEVMTKEVTALVEETVEASVVQEVNVAGSEKSPTLLQKEAERKRLGLDFVMPEPTVPDTVANQSPPIPSQPVVVPKAPIKGILKNTSRFGGSVDHRKESRDVRDDWPTKKKSSADKGACWNIRGLNALDKQQEVRSFVRNNNVSICAVLESHVRQEALGNVCSTTFGRWDWISNQAACESGTRIILAWDALVVDVMAIEYHRQFIHCEVRIKGSTNVFFVSFVYGDNHGRQRMHLWSGLRKFKAIMGNKAWVVLGDFNCMLFPHDALGGISRRNGDMDDFATCLEDIELFDVRFTGIHHTWCQKPKTEEGLKRKLDRCLANTEFTNLFEDASARFMPRGLSDHSAALLGFAGGVRKRNFGFKFDNFLAGDPQFLPLVRSHWNMDVQGTFMFRLTSKLKALKTPLRKLRSAYGNLSSRSNSLKEELDVAQLTADLDPHNLELGKDVERIRDAYQKSCWADFAAARQRAKVKWLTEGDANTRYFHRVIEERRHARHMHCVCNMEGVYVYDDDVATAFIEHFVSILGQRDESVIPDMDDALFVKRLSITDSNHMIRQIQDVEIRDALFGIGNDKAPGSDGFSSKFFKASWDIVGKDLLLAIHNFFYRGHLAKELNHTLICILPKKPNATLVSEFRPIACCSVLYKCISKVIVERMKPYLDALVSRSQSAFIPGRRIGDNILMAHELVKGYHLDTGPPRCAFKIDLRKAYDMVSWDFLICMLKGFDFHPVLIKWITEMVSTPTFSVVVNGEARGFFHGKRGIRQGDPLSPYLFTLVMEGFAMIFRQCIEEAVGFGYHYGCHDFGLTHLCFADDLFVFTRGDVQSVEVLKKALQLFASRSGLSPNLQKSDVFFGNVPSNVRATILHCLPFRMGTFPIRYLGVPLSPISLRAADYGVLISKVKLRLQNWKSKFLSFGGRKQLITSVLQSLQQYWMAFFLLPSGVVHDLERLFRDFLWAQGDSSRGKCKVAWDLVCRPLDCGGFGFRRLGLWNRSLLAKSLWDIVAQRNCLWVAWTSRYAIRTDSVWTAKRSSRWSWVLTKIMALRTEYRRFVWMRVGNGTSTNAWEDRWLTCGHLSQFISYRFIHNAGFSMTTTVSQLLDTFHNGWPDSWVARYPFLANVNVPMINHLIDDMPYWSIDGSEDGYYSARMAYEAIVGNMPKLHWTSSVWFKGHIPKHSFCLWTACLLRLPTQDRVALWKEEPPDLLCVFCGLTSDSHNHLFFECPFSRQVWLQVMDKVHWIGFPCSWNAIVDAISDHQTSPKGLQHRLALAATVYTIWCERNHRMFAEISKPIPHLVQTIMTAVLDRMAWKRRKRHLVNHVDST
ncbi:hypothetical protein OSB04_un000139 [Centaurea solstitialis]|uniref:Reverse transcriptase domain-containing protein n=1 Tax=Centaurea solstitialis TaxID=347529 RepID=A0AA38SHX1_9ASTR|nr:hypothetical protein OSB04_un000139 [Centaurea solstitialis]